MPVETLKYPDFSKKPLNVDWDKVKKLMESICHPYWYKQSNGFKEAKLQAAQNNQKILLAFTGYSHCSCCQSLEANVFNKCDFGFWSIRNHLILVNIDDANATQEDYELFNQFNVKYIPSVFGLASNGEVLGSIQTNYCGSAGVTAWTTEFANIAQINKSVPIFKIKK